MTKKKMIGLTAAVLSSLFVISTGVEPALARDGGGGGGHGGGGGGGHSFSGGGGHSFSGGSGRSTSASRMSGNRDGARVYGYQARGNHGHGHGHGRRFFAGPYGYYDYGYSDGTCAYEYNRAVTTGSSYWWNRYEDCTG